MKYIVEGVEGEFPAQFGKVRVNFTVENNPNKISGFFLRAPLPGDELEGDIIQKGQYYNFSFPKRAAPSSPGTLQPVMDALMKMDRNVLATLQWMQKIGPTLDLLIKRLETKGVLDAMQEPQNTRRITTDSYPPSNGPTVFDEEYGPFD